MYWLKIGIVFWVSLFVSMMAVLLIRKIATYYKIGALPSRRKIHQNFVPLLGGLGFLGGMIFGYITAELLGLFPGGFRELQMPFWGGLGVIILVGLIDDIRGITHLQKFSGQFLSAVIVVGGGCVIEAFYSPMGYTLQLGWIGYPFSILWIMLVMNALNLLDGLDGLAGGISLIISIGFLVIAATQGNIPLSILMLVLIGAILGFLKYNYHPASIFMGDVGSLMLGYLLACFSIETLKVARSHQIYFLASLVLLGMPLTDTLISFFRRMGQGDHPFKADREHIHHRLLGLGVSHLDTVWLMYYFTSFYMILAVLMVLYREIVGISLFLVAFSFSLFWAWRLGYLETRQMISFGLREQETPASMRPNINISRIWHQIFLLMGDIFSTNLALLLTFWFRFQSGMIGSFNSHSLSEYFYEPVFIIFSAIWLLLFWLNGLYQMPWDVSRYDKAVRVSKVITFGAICLLILLNLDLLIEKTAKNPLNSNQISTLIFYWAAMIGCVNLVRLFIIEVEKKYQIFEYTLKNTLMIGTTRKARNIIRQIEGNPHLLYEIVGVVDWKAKESQFEGYPLLGRYDELSELIQKYRVEEIIVVMNEISKEDLLSIIGVCERLQVVVRTLPSLHEIVVGRKPPLIGDALVRIFPERMLLWQWLVKRMIDIGISVISGILLLPLWGLLAVLLRSCSRKPVLVKQTMLGRHGRIYSMYFFRTSDARDVSGQKQLKELPKSRIIRFLDNTPIYKLPLLFNVLRGDMSVVGPRPYAPGWYRMHKQKLRFLHRRLMVRPGITGITQLRYPAGKDEKLREELQQDIFYVENISLNLDCRIILRSVFSLFRNGR